jgi:hypothetical protein
MTYHSTSHPIRKFFGLRGLGAVDQPTTDGTGMYMTSLTPYNVSSLMAPMVPNALKSALSAAGLITVSDSTGWSSDGHVFAKYLPGTGMTDASRQTALAAAVSATSKSIGGGAVLLLPGQSAPAGAVQSPGPAATVLTPLSSVVVLPSTQLQNFLIGHGFDIGSASADGVFGTNSSNAMNQALAAAGQSSGGYTVSSDKHTVTVQTSAWSALASLPTRPPVRSGGSTVTPTVTLPDGTVIPGSTGPDWGSLLPWIIGGVALVGVGGFALYESKRHPRAKLTVKNRRRFVAKNARRAGDYTGASRFDSGPDDSIAVGDVFQDPEGVRLRVEEIRGDKVRVSATNLDEPRTAWLNLRTMRINIGDYVYQRVRYPVKNAHKQAKRNGKRRSRRAA